MANRKRKPTKAQWELLERLKREPLWIIDTIPRQHAHLLECHGYVECLEDGRHAITDEGKAALKERRKRNGKG